MHQEAIDHLTAEHDRILVGLDVIEALSQQIEAGQSPWGLIDRALGWLGTFGRCHHLKEERELFPVMANHSLPNSVKILWEEHCRGEIGLSAMGDGLQAAKDGHKNGGAKFREAANNFIVLYREHVEKENTFLLPPIEIIPEAELTKMLNGFRNLEAQILGDDGAARMDALLKELREEVLGA